ncbi:MAG: protein jag [Defluviitaleaceae bacterium]|nr:protein jag [Defluviitaleaceae bacterium]MCL2204316.1 protein jag [Defluviitaleaceae bacterium]MCL2240470.1 protein jag [Defluviitaleaceae bacterium]
MHRDRIEKSGKTPEEAIAAALKVLDATQEDVTIEIVDPGAKGGLFGIGGRPALVAVERKFDPVRTAKEFLREVTLAMGLSVAIETTRKEKYLNINVVGENLGILIGKRGATLDALQYLTNLVVNRCGVPEFSVILDTENYRRRRRETLEGLAHNLARKVKAIRKPVSLEPMSRYERHVIHTVLQHDKSVRTFSEGNEPFRHVVITTK